MSNVVSRVKQIHIRLWLSVHGVSIVISPKREIRLTAQIETTSSIRVWSLRVAIDADDDANVGRLARDDVCDFAEHDRTNSC